MFKFWLSFVFICVADAGTTVFSFRLCYIFLH